MADIRYLKKQRFKDASGEKRDGHSWYFCMAIPSALRGKFVSQGRNGKPGKPLSKIVEKLGTQSLSEAQEKRWPLVHQWRETFKRTLTGEPLSPAEIEAEAREVYTATLEEMEADARLRKPSIGAQLQELEATLEVCFSIAPEATDDFEAVAHRIAAVQRRKGVTIEPGTETYKMLGRAIIRASVAAIEGRMKALKAQPSEPPITFLGPEGIDPVTLRPIAPLRRHQVRIRDDDQGMRFSEAAALYIEQMQRDPNAKLAEHTRQQSESVFDLFKNFTDDAPITSITKSTAVGFLDLVAKLDPHWNHIKPDPHGNSVKKARELPLTELVEKCAGRPGRLSNRTINRYVTSLSSVFKWADKRSDVDIRNPFRGQSREEGTGTGWRSYTVEELKKLFGSELFKDATAAQRIRPNENTFKTAMLWIPLIALFSGMRSNEICQLRVSDVIRKGKVWAFRVSDEGEGQSVKTEAATRIVPVHSELVRCGFLEYLKTLPPDGRVFPALKPGGADGKFNFYFSKRFTAYRRRCEVTAPRVAFHSFRKNAAQALKDKRATPAEIAELIGHEQGFTLATYAPLQLPLPALSGLIERIRYAGLKLDHLYVE